MLFKINIIDDEKNLNDLVRTYLEKEGYSVCSFYTYDEALLHKDDDVHLWLIDIMLDKASWFLNCLMKLKHQSLKCQLSLCRQETKSSIVLLV